MPSSFALGSSTRRSRSGRRPPSKPIVRKSVLRFISFRHPEGPPSARTCVRPLGGAALLVVVSRFASQWPGWRGPALWRPGQWSGRPWLRGDRGSDPGFSRTFYRTFYRTCNRSATNRGRKQAAVTVIEKPDLRPERAFAKRAGNMLGDTNIANLNEAPRVALIVRHQTVPQVKDVHSCFPGTKGGYGESIRITCYQNCEKTTPSLVVALAARCILSWTGKTFNDSGN